MAVDTSAIPVKDVIEREAVVNLANRVRWHGQHIFKGTCPFCGGNDRFAVFEDDNTFLCGINKGNGCGKHGDVIAFLEIYHNWTFAQALNHLKEQYGLVTDGTPYERVKKTRPIEEDTAPCVEWQKQAVMLVKEASDFLWSDGETPRKARNYLFNRGLTEETIKSWKLGYVVADRYEKRSAWGIADETDKNGKVHTHIYIPRGWLIPWFLSGEYGHRVIWRLDIRRHPTDIRDAKEPIGKYSRVKGGSEGLFNASAIKEGCPLVVVESPLDAIIGTQETSNEPAIIWSATGSTGGARKLQWCEAMSKAYPVLAAFDSDDPGNKTFDHWKEQAFEPFRWVPTAHDITDMKLAGQSILDWTLSGVEVALELDVLLHPETTTFDTETQAKEESTPASPGQTAFLAIAHELASVFPDGCDVREVDRAFAQRIANLPDCPSDARPPITEKQDRICQTCAANGRKASGVKLVKKGDYPSQNVYKRTPDQPYSFAWVASERLWYCPGCGALKRSLPTVVTNKKSPA